MKTTDIAIVGGGPAGLCAAISAASSGARVSIIERNQALGGQLNKQTHMFFGSERQYASTRGIDITDILLNEIKKYEDRVEIINNTNVVGLYEDKVITLMENESKYYKMKPEAIIVATGAYEKFLTFPNNDLPGIYGAGAVQTLMNVYGVKPGERVLMVGAGNIGLIVSYQLMQAGVKVVAIIDAAPRIGGYLVHASKIRRMGIPIYTNHTVKEAIGLSELEKAVIWQVDQKFQPILNTEKTFDVDVMCISVGLSPLNELLSMAGCEMKYVSSLSGFVPYRYSNYETTIDSIFTAGDSGGIEEASSAMVEGYLAGLHAAAKVGKRHASFDEKIQDYNSQLSNLRSGPEGAHILSGISQIERRRDYA
ncbi:MAG: NAD(P)/FAD-dependent oxidoreductase [Dethiosulfatibacter sp.]|nr:NAD(P)/FAD-dependent oxidoreductase [Dethiosulfatibacter sp.]